MTIRRPRRQAQQQQQQQQQQQASNKMTKRKRQAANGRKGEIVFDPEARNAYLKGFSERKRQRRTFGLAMQKVKDRKAKLDERAEVKKAVKEQIEQAEKQKEELLEEALQEQGNSVAILEVAEEAPVEQVQAPPDSVVKYEDEHTQSQWGGEVIVTTTTNIPGYSSDEEQDDSGKRIRRKNIDAEQEFAGNVEKFMKQLKGNLPGKKKDSRQPRHKGKHGAAGMKGMATGQDLKLAQKALAISEGKRKGKFAGRKKGGKSR